MAAKTWVLHFMINFPRLPPLPLIKSTFFPGGNVSEYARHLFRVLDTDKDNLVRSKPPIFQKKILNNTCFPLN